MHDFVDYIKVNGTYEVQNLSLILTIRKMLKIGSPKFSIFIDTPFEQSPPSHIDNPTINRQKISIKRDK